MSHKNPPSPGPSKHVADKEPNYNEKPAQKPPAQRPTPPPMPPPPTPPAKEPKP